MTSNDLKRPQMTSNDLAKAKTSTETIVKRSSDERNKNVSKAGSVQENIENIDKYLDEILRKNKL